MNKRKSQPNTYFDTAACGLVSNAIASPGISFYQELKQNSSQRASNWRNEEVDRIRKCAAGFLDAPASNIGLIPSFSYGMNAVVQSLSGEENVLLYEHDYPSLVNPFRVNDFDISWFSDEGGFHINSDTIEQKLKSEKIDLLAISHVQWLTGAKVDIETVLSICHQHDVPVIVDATQSLGAMPISIKELNPDVLISSNYKWMNAGFGTGIIYLSDDFIEEYPPVMGGVNSYATENGEEVRQPSVLDLEPGHKNMAGFSVMEASIKDKQKRGLAKIAEHNRQLTSKFIEACPDLPVSLIGPSTMENRSAIVVLKDENDLGVQLQNNNSTVTLRNETVRLSFHYYNTLDEVEQLINCIKEMLSS